MKKVIMNLEDYKGKYAMHCPTKESAELFCEFLDKNGRIWNDGYSYLCVTFWDYRYNGVFYFFNEGRCSYEGEEDNKYDYFTDYTILKTNYIVLEIEDFIKEVEE